MSTTDFRPNKLLCVVAHPDDIEVTLGGTIAKWVSEGTEVSFLICTDGANGTSNADHAGSKLAAQRAKEQAEASRILGAACFHQLDYSDGSVELGDNLRRDIVAQIRAHKPDTVFTMDPTFLYSTRWSYPNHRDHRVVGQATFDAVYPLARDITSFSELIEQGLEPHVVDHLIMTNFNVEDQYVDITDFFDAKINALKAHHSQFPDPTRVVNKLTERSREVGQAAGVELAEGFVHLRIFG